MSRKKNKLLTFIGVSSIPLIAFPLLLVEIFNRRIYAVYLLAFMMGLWSIWLLPTGDLYRHTLLYYELKEYDLAQFQDFLKFRPDCLFYILVYLFGKIGFHFEWIRFLSTFGGYALYFTIFFDYIKSHSVLTRKKYLFIFALFFFYIPFVEIGCGIRFAFSSALLAFATYRLYAQGKITAYLLGIVACLIHFGQFPLFVLICICRNCHHFKFKYFFLLISLLFVIGGQTLFITIAGVLPISDIYQQIIISYTQEVIKPKEINFYTKLYIIFSGFPILISVIYLIFTKNKSNFITLSAVLFVFYSLMFAFPIGNRYASFFIFSNLLAYLHGDFEKKQKSWYGILFFISFSLLFMLKFYYWRQVIPYTRTFSFLYSPVTVTFFHYDSLPLILQNVDMDGSLLTIF